MKMMKQTPDEALDLLRSLVFAYESTLTNSILNPMSEEATKSLTDYHVALGTLQRYVDAITLRQAPASAV